MQAVYATGINADAPLEVLAVGERPEPAVPGGWARIRVRAASLNHHDLWTLRGVGVRPEQVGTPLGTDAAGVTDGGREVIVHAVLGSAGPGDDETLAPDLHLLSEAGISGTHAEVVAAPERNLVPKPANLSWAEAACLPTAYLTAYRMLFTRAGLRPGAHVLVQGAGGGVATAAIILAHAAGIEVSVTSRSAAKREAALAVGADTAIEVGGRLARRADAVIETVGAATWDHSLKSLRPGGVIVVAGATTGGDPPAQLARLFWRGLSVLGSTMGTRQELTALVAMLETTGARPLVDAIHPLASAEQAYARLAGGDAFGKVVLEVDAEPGPGCLGM
jgi:NADPH:quinone reductase-like Zn-dependent oxidoreductase